MYKKGKYKIVSNRALTSSIYEMILEGDTQYITSPGQFVNIEVKGLYLRRPISVCDYDERSIRLIYKVVGEGTTSMSSYEAGVELDLLTGLGNGFHIDERSMKPLLVGGGVGVPPLYNLCRELIAKGKEVTVVLGFNKADEIFLYDDFVALGAKVVVTTVDGSVGVKGFVTTAMSDIDYDFVYSCGPIPMLKAVYDRSGEVDGEYSFEERMGCGFGACVGCTCKTKYGYKRICKDGPVLNRDEIIW